MSRLGEVRQQFRSEWHTWLALFHTRSHVILALVHSSVCNFLLSEGVPGTHFVPDRKLGKLL